MKELKPIKKENDQLFFDLNGIYTLTLSFDKNNGIPQIDSSIDGQLWGRCDNSFFSPKIVAIADNIWCVDITGFRYIRIYNVPNVKVLA